LKLKPVFLYVDDVCNNLLVTSSFFSFSFWCIEVWIVFQGSMLGALFIRAAVVIDGMVLYNVYQWVIEI